MLLRSLYPMIKDAEVETAFLRLDFVHATGIRTVLTCILARFGITRSARAAMLAEEFPISPPRIKKGWLLTMSWPDPFCIWMWGEVCTL